MVDVFLDHALDAADMALDAFQPIHDGAFLSESNAFFLALPHPTGGVQG